MTAGTPHTADAHAPTTGAPVLSVRNLSTVFGAGERQARAVSDVSFDLAPGQILGVVGESGSGKSALARSIMRMVPSGGRITAGGVSLHGRDLLTMSERGLREVRGRDIAMVFQDPLAVLNPVKSVGWQVEEALQVHGASRRSARARAIELLNLVGIPDPQRRAGEYPHQFSGGMRQRAVIAIALANSASVLLADEPTTALDVTIQAQILRLLARLRSELGVAIIMITHDLGVVSELCDDLLVMYAGRVVERGPVADLLARPAHPYLRDLLHAMPRLEDSRSTRLPAIAGAPPDPAALPAGCAFHPRCRLTMPQCRHDPPPPGPVACWLDPPLPPVEADAVPAKRTAESVAVDGEPVLEVEGIRTEFGSRWSRTPPLVAVADASLSIAPGETLGLVGESGSGKSTLARTIVGVHRATAGRVKVAGSDVTRGHGPESRRAVQYVFQDPYASLNPRLTVRQILAEALRQRGVPRARIDAEAGDLLELVGLSGGQLARYPHEFSGGQRQRIGVARALAVRPRLLICDEPVSALDVSIQAQIINVLAGLRDELGLALLFIAHDLAVVRQLSDRVAVMYLGQIVETGPVDEVYARPRHPYTRALLDSVPGGGGLALPGEPPDARRPPSGCPFRTRCPVGPLTDADRTVCSDTVPVLAGEGEHRAACHFPMETA